MFRDESAAILRAYALRLHQRVFAPDRGSVLTVLFVDTFLMIVAVSLVLLSGIFGAGTSGIIGPPLALLSFAAATTVVFYLFGVPRKMWRHFATQDMPNLIGATGAAVVFGAVIVVVLSGYPVLTGRFLTSLAVVWLSFLALVSVARILWAAIIRSSAAETPGPAKPVRVLLAGAGADTNRLLRQLRALPSPPVEVVGIIDERPGETGRTIGNAAVLGTCSDFRQVAKALEVDGRKPERLIITEAVTPTHLRALATEALELDIVASELPSAHKTMAELVEGNIPASPLTLEALVGRAPLSLDPAVITRLVRGQKVLVTGAGGSIGQQLVEMIAGFAPANITILDNSEFNLWKVDSTLARTNKDLARNAWIADVRDRAHLDRIFDRVRPDLVFHAAALKHVPIVEANPAEGVLTNVVGSRNVADASLRSGVKAMVQVSTDKSVKPACVMGATKRIAELYCQALDLDLKSAGAGAVPRFMTVRFGNVLGSSGSVVPIFQDQIESGGPVTVTHPDVERYFMTIREACELVLHAAAQGVNERSDRGVITVLDMGKPVRIVDVARQMILLNGRRPDTDIGIEFVGLRPGEKLTEELFDPCELPLPGAADGLHSAKSAARPLSEVTRAIAELEGLARYGSKRELLDALDEVIHQVSPKAAAGRFAA